MHILRVGMAYLTYIRDRSTIKRLPLYIIIATIQFTMQTAKKQGFCSRQRAS